MSLPTMLTKTGAKLDENFALYVKSYQGRKGSFYCTKIIMVFSSDYVNLTVAIKYI